MAKKALEWLINAVKLESTNSTFISKDIIDEALKMQREEIIITDEEIERASELHYLYERWAFVQGAKWYREQLSKGYDKEK